MSQSSDTAKPELCGRVAEPIGCPFCNAPARLIKVYSEKPTDQYRYVCSALYQIPPARCPSLVTGTPIEALDAWNTRL